MDRSDMLTLISQHYTADQIGQQVARETKSEIYCNVSSVSASEWMEAGRMGLKPEYRFTIFADDYAGQTVAEYQGQRYGIYRTYRKSNDELELYAERKAGDECPTGSAC